MWRLAMVLRLGYGYFARLIGRPFADRLREKKVYVLCARALPAPARMARDFTLPAKAAQMRAIHDAVLARRPVPQ